MNELTDFSKEKIMTSREIAELTGKHHKHAHVMRDIDNLNESYDKLHRSKIGEMFSIRELPIGGAAKDVFCELNKIQTFDLMTV
jgi:phage regulator Rha-like protein